MYGGRGWPGLGEKTNNQTGPTEPAGLVWSDLELSRLPNSPVKTTVLDFNNRVNKAFNKVKKKFIHFSLYK